MNRSSAPRFLFSVRSLPMAFALALTLALTLASASIAAADGIIIPIRRRISPSPGAMLPLAIKYHRVEVTIDDQVATTQVDQVFVNEASYRSRARTSSRCRRTPPSRALTCGWTASSWRARCWTATRPAHL